MSTSILVIVDPTASEVPALSRAQWFASLGANGSDRARVELFVCDYDQYLSGDRFFDSKSLQRAREELLARRRGELEARAAPLRAAGIEVTVDVRWDHPLHAGIQRKIEEARPDIVIKDTHYHSAVRRTLFTNTDWHLIRDCPCPLWLVKPHEKAPLGKIGVAVDPTHEHDKPASLDEKLIGTAREIAAKAGAGIAIVHAFDPAPAYAVSADSMTVPASTPVTEFIDELRKWHTESVHELVARAAPGTKPVIVEGEIRESLVGAVRDSGIDLLVMGAVSRSALSRLMLGSTAERVLDFIPCDLLIVKPDKG